MKRSSATLTAAVFGIGLFLSPAGDAHGQFFKKLFSKDLDKAPSSGELQQQEASAATMVNNAQAAESRGQSGKALNLYKKVVGNYPLTNSAAIAQYKIGELLEEDGKLIKAFDEYQEFITQYRQSTQYAAAIDRQFKIASAAMEDKTSSFFGLKTSTQRSTVIEMFEKVIANAPRSPYAADSQFRIGEIYQEQKKVAAATAAFQKVVDNYPGSELSSKAAYRLANVNLSTVQRSKDSTNVRTARQDLESAVSLFPNSDQTSEAIEALSGLDETEAEKSMSIAKFYEKRRLWKAAAIYYTEVAKSGTTFSSEAREKLTELSTDNPDIESAPSLQNGLDPLSFPSRDGGVSAGLLGGTPADIPTIKTRPDYLGPPAPDLERLLRKPEMRTTLPSALDVQDPTLPAPPTAASPAGSSLLDTIDTAQPLTDTLDPGATLPEAPKFDNLNIPDEDDDIGVDEPAAEESADEEPADEESADEEPADEEPADEESADEEPAPAPDPEP